VLQGVVSTGDGIIDSDVDDFMDCLGASAAVLTIRALRDQAERTRRHELERAIRRLRQGKSPESALEHLSQGLTNKLLHPPTQALHRAQEADREQLVKLLERVYLISGRE
jgi:glutamyl-tRNA reductase